MQELFNITLPLHLGLQTAKDTINYPHNTSSTFGTADIQCAITLPMGNILQHFQKKGELMNLVLKETQRSKNLLQVNCEPVTAAKNVSENLLGQKQKQEVDSSIFPFEVNFKLTTDTFRVIIHKNLVNFNLAQIPKPKFVKNSHLQSISKGANTDQWGLITMDQASRIVIQGKTIDFPAIGFWLNEKNTDSLDFTKKLVEYCSMKIAKKCRFSSEGKKYFYFVKFSQDLKTPELYLVQWKQFKEDIITLEYSVNELMKKQQMRIRSDQNSYLEFTLRSDEKIPKKLQNIELSPIIYHEQSSSKSVILSEPDSPRFSHSKKSHLEQQCQTLRKLVQIQQKQIDHLKSQLLRATSAMKHSSQKESIKKQSQHKIYLTEKDLSLGSLSEHPSTNTSTNDVQQDVPCWDRYEMINE